MKRLHFSRMTLFAVVFALAFTACIFTSCAGLETPEQEDAALRTAGRFLAVGMVAAKPEIVPAAKAYCASFEQADQAEALDLITLASGYLQDEFADRPGVMDAALDIAILLGFDRLPSESEVTDADTERLIEQVRMVVRGFCYGLEGFAPTI